MEDSLRRVRNPEPVTEVLVGVNNPLGQHSLVLGSVDTPAKLCADLRRPDFSLGAFEVATANVTEQMYRRHSHSC